MIGLTALLCNLFFAMNLTYLAKKKKKRLGWLFFGRYLLFYVTSGPYQHAACHFKKSVVTDCHACRTLKLCYFPCVPFLTYFSCVPYFCSIANCSQGIPPDETCMLSAFGDMTRGLYCFYVTVLCIQCVPM